MRIGVIDSIKLLSAKVTEKEHEEIQEKYNASLPVLLFYANKRAVKIMESAVPMKPTQNRDADDRVRFYCPDCTADISDWKDGWGFCPYCGQAVTMQEDGAHNEEDDWNQNHDRNAKNL